jgi:hypothetical protein
MAEQQKRAADPIHQAIERLVSQAASSGESIWPAGAALQLHASFPETRMSPAEVAEALVRAAAGRRLSLALKTSEVAREI